MSIRDDTTIAMRKKISNSIMQNEDLRPVIFTPLPSSKFTLYYTLMSYIMNVRYMNIEKKFKFNKDQYLFKECRSMNTKGVQNFYLLDGTPLNQSLLVGDLYDMYKSEDGILYIEYL